MTTLCLDWIFEILHSFRPLKNLTLGYVNWIFIIHRCQRWVFITIKHFRPKKYCSTVLPVRRKKRKLDSCDKRIMRANNILWLATLGGEHSCFHRLWWDKNMWSIWTVFQEDPTEGGFHPLKRPVVEEWCHMVIAGSLLIPP